MMAKTANTDGLDLETITGRLAYAIKTAGPSFVSKNTTLSKSTIDRLSNGRGSTTLEASAEIAIATGFELKWIALGEGPQRFDRDLWVETNRFKKPNKLDENQVIDFSFSPDLFERKATTPDQCFAWVVQSQVNLKQIKTGHTVLIDTSKPISTGTIIIKANGHYLLGDLQINLDGTARFKTDISAPDSDQNLTKDQLKNLDFIGHVIWFGA